MQFKLKTERDHEVYNEALKKTHDTSPNTRKLIKNMEDKFDNLKDKVHNIEGNLVRELGHVELRITKEVAKAINDVKLSCDKSYAPLWVANALKLVMVTTFVAIIGSAMTLILK